MSIFRPTLSFKGKTFNLSGFSAKETLISASAVPTAGQEQKQTTTTKCTSDLKCDRNAVKHKHLIITVVPVRKCIATT